VVAIINHLTDIKPDNGVYAPSLYHMIQQLIMEESHEKHLEPN